MLSSDERAELLRIAHVSIQEFRCTGIVPPGAPHPKPLRRPARVAVTAWHGDTHRRSPVCSGPLFKVVQEQAVAVAGDSDTPLTRLDILLVLDAPSEEPSSVTAFTFKQGTRTELVLPGETAPSSWDERCPCAVVEISDAYTAPAPGYSLG